MAASSVVETGADKCPLYHLYHIAPSPKSESVNCPSLHISVITVSHVEGVLWNPLLLGRQVIVVFLDDHLV